MNLIEELNAVKASRNNNKFLVALHLKLGSVPQLFVPIIVHCATCAMCMQKLVFYTKVLIGSIDVKLKCIPNTDMITTDSYHSGKLLTVNEFKY